jgi:hypothetical protein
MAAACGVELVEIKELGSCARERELEHIGKLALAPGQDIYVGDAVEMTVRGPGIAGRHPFSIVAGQEMVGVGTLHVGAATDAGWPHDDGAILLRGFLIGRSHLNTLPGSDTNRYLAGQGAGANGAYTFWTDAFAVVGNPEEAPTVATANQWAQQTARGVGIEFPEMLPDRRIDYVWTYGWAYGRPGCPVAMQRSFTDTTRYGYPASDHYGLTVDFWTPPVLAPEPAELLRADDMLTGQLMLDLEDAVTDGVLV